MSIILGILLTFIVFLIVVLIHEFGHFYTARLTGMKVEEFGFGIPPRLKTLFRDKKWTEYTFNALPIGWFVRIMWEDSHSPDKDKPGAFMTKKWYQRALVLVAWVSMNFLLAWVIFAVLFMTGARPVTIAPFSDKPTGSFFIPSFSEARDMNFITYSWVVFTPLTGSIAYQAGIREGDILESINWKTVNTREAIIEIIRENQPMDIFVKRDWQSVPITVTPEKWKVGMYINYDWLVVHEDFSRKESLPRALMLAGQETYASSILTLNFLGEILTKLISPKAPGDRDEAKSLLSGPIGVGSTFVSMVDAHVPFATLLLVIALLSINLWVVNLLPFPALDGWRLVTTTVSSLLSYFPRASRWFNYFERLFHMIWFIFLLFVMLYVAWLDISKFF